MLLLFRSGEVYELFYEDAEVVSRLLGVPLGRRHKAPHCALPHHALEAHLKKLLRAGHRVAVCDPVEKAPTEEPGQRTLTQGNLFGDDAV
jgi:DNA mismatch repair protein MutS